MGFWAGFEKQAYRYVASGPLKSEAAKEHYKKEHVRGKGISGGVAGGVLGGLVGSAIAEHPGSTLKHVGKGALRGAAVGAITAGLGSHLLAKHTANRHAKQGYGEVYAKDLPDLRSTMETYRELNKRK